MKNNFIKLILLVILINFSLCKERGYSLSPKQKKYINQAKSLESAGLMDEAKDIYDVDCDIFAPNALGGVLNSTKYHDWNAT